MRQNLDVIIAYIIMLGLIILVVVLLFRPSGIFKGKII